MGPADLCGKGEASPDSAPLLGRHRVPSRIKEKVDTQIEEETVHSEVGLKKMLEFFKTIYKKEKSQTQSPHS